MKKIFTLLLAVGAITAAQPQSSRTYPADRSTNRDVILGNRNDRNDRDDCYDKPYENSTRERDKQIDRINRDYDKRIRQVERDRRLRSSEKAYQVRQLEDHRRQKIRGVWERF